MDNSLHHAGGLPHSMKYIVFKELIKLIYKLKSENNTSFKVAILTAAGTIVGNIAPCSHENEMIKYTDDPTKFTFDTSSIFDVLSKQYQPGNGESEYSDAYMVNVLDATVFEHGMTGEGKKIEQIILFADQIIGFSLVRQ
jgi:hypothetical protein